MPRTPNERRGGQRGNTRGKELQVRKRRNREADKKRAAVMAEIEAERQALQARIDAETANPVMTPAAGAAIARQLEENRVRREAAERLIEGAEEQERAVKVPDLFRYRFVIEHVAPTGKVTNKTFIIQPPPQLVPKEKLPFPEAEGKSWSHKHARALFKQGYNVIHCMMTTGWGINLYRDLPMDEQGYYLPDE